MDDASLDQAALLIDAGQYAGALRILEPCLAARPDDVRVLCLTAAALIEMSGSRRAVQLTSSALARQADHGLAYRLQAQAYNRLRQFDLAQRAAYAAARVQPEDWRNHYLAAVSDLWRGGGSEATLARMERARSLDPEVAEVHRMYGIVASELGRRREAAAAFRTALKLQPDHAAAQQDLARLHLDSNRFGPALLAFGSAGRLDPSLPGLADGVSDVLERFEGLSRYPVLIALTATGFWPRPAAAIMALAVALLGWRTWHAGGPTLIRLTPSILRHNSWLAAWFAGQSVALLVVLVNGVLGLEYVRHPGPDTFSWGWHPIMPLFAAAAAIFYFKRPLPFWRMVRQIRFR